jgi:DNA replication protein DnaC
MERTPDGLGTKEFIRVLLLLEKATLEELSAAVEYATSLGIADADTIRVILEHRRESPVALFCLDSRPHLKLVHVPPTDITAYASLLERERRAAERRLKAARFPQTKTLDEFDFGQQPSTTELLFDVLSTAYERQSLIVTTNLPFEQWTEVLGSERLTGAALDRLTHRCHILEAKGESFRLRDARRRQRRTSGPS